MNIIALYYDPTDGKLQLRAIETLRQHFRIAVPSRRYFAWYDPEEPWSRPSHEVRTLDIIRLQQEPNGTMFVLYGERNAG